MVYLYTCQACLDDNHAKCEIGQRAPKGVFGGSHCRCGCNGNPKWNDPAEIQKSIQKELDRIFAYEEIDRKRQEVAKKDSKKYQDAPKNLRTKRPKK